MSKEEEKKIEDIKSIFCRCQDVRPITTPDGIAHGWRCSCEVLFKDNTEETFFFGHIGMMKEPSKEEEHPVEKA